MPSTQGFETQEEAIEAWNTWAGMVRIITQQEYNELNDSINRDYPIGNGKLVMPDGEHAFGDLVIADPGGYESPWPRIYFSDYARAERGLYSDDMFTVYKLRSRWRLIEKNHLFLKQKVRALLCENDRDNKRLNAQLAVWNKLLLGSGFPEFRDNDLRGVDLSGLSLVPVADRRVNLRQIDFSYAECHLLSIQNGNLYGAKCTGLKGVQMELNQCTCHGVTFSCSFLPQSKFIESDLGLAKIDNSTASMCSFDGANCHGIDFSSSLLRRASFGCIRTTSDATKCADLTDAKWNDESRFEEAMFNELLREQNLALYEHIEALKVGRSIGKDVLSSIEAKPGIFGFAIDLKALGAGLKRWFVRKRSNS